MFDFNKVFSSFQESKLNGRDVMIMQSDRNAQEMIKVLDMWKDLNRYFANGDEAMECLWLEYPEEMKDMIDCDVNRVAKVAMKYFDRK